MITNRSALSPDITLRQGDASVPGNSPDPSIFADPPTASSIGEWRDRRRDFRDYNELLGPARGVSRVPV